MAVETLTFGCRLNTVEAEVMRGHAEAASRDRDLVVVNTCAVTTEAGRQARKAIRRLGEARVGRAVDPGYDRRQSHGEADALREMVGPDFDPDAPDCA